MSTGSIEVPPGALQSASRTLTGGAEALDSTAGSVPAGVDAGPMTGLITSLIASVMTECAAVAQVLGAGSQAVLHVDTAFGNTDQQAGAGFGIPKAGLLP